MSIYLPDNTIQRELTSAPMVSPDVLPSLLDLCLSIDPLRFDSVCNANTSPSSIADFDRLLLRRGDSAG